MKNIAFFVSAEKPEALSCAENSAVILSQLGCNCFASVEFIAKLKTEIQEIVQPCSRIDVEKHADVVVSFGGDGTMLSAARFFADSDLPIMGINIGKLGFLAEFSVSNLEQNLKNLAEGKFRISDRNMLETDLDGERIFTLNDFVIEKKNTSRMITIHAYANEKYIGDYRADGIIVTTPTGSTAYSLSCGGPIIAPSTEVICITPICPHTLTVRPLVISDKNELRFVLSSPTGEASLVADGQVEKHLKNNDSIVIRKSKSKAKLIKPLENSYYDLLRNKLLWAVNIGDIKN